MMMTIPFPPSNSFPPVASCSCNMFVIVIVIIGKCPQPLMQLSEGLQVSGHLESRLIFYAGKTVSSKERLFIYSYPLVFTPSSYLYQTVFCVMIIIMLNNESVYCTCVTWLAIM